MNRLIDLPNGQPSLNSLGIASLVTMNYSFKTVIDPIFGHFYLGLKNNLCTKVGLDHTFLVPSLPVWDIVLCWPNKMRYTLFQNFYFSLFSLKLGWNLVINFMS